MISDIAWILAGWLSGKFRGPWKGNCASVIRLVTQKVKSLLLLSRINVQHAKAQMAPALPRGHTQMTAILEQGAGKWLESLSTPAHCLQKHQVCVRISWLQSAVNRIIVKSL